MTLKGVEKFKTTIDTCCCHKGVFKVNYWSLLSLIPGISHSFLGIYVLFIGPKRLLNIVFSLLAFSLAIWSLSEFGHRITNSQETAYLWIKISAFGWCFMSSFYAHYVILFARRKKMLKSKLTYAALYIPSLIFLILAFKTDFIYIREPVEKFFGYTAMPGMFVWFYIIYYVTTYTIATYLLWEVTKKGITLERKQARPIFIGSTGFLLLTTVTNVSLPAFGITAPELGTLFSLLWAISVFYSVLKHKLFIIQPIIEENVSSPKKYHLEGTGGYFVEEEKPDKGYEIFYDHITHGGFGLCVTKFSSDRIREKYKLIKTPVIHLTSGNNGERGISIKDIDALTMMISNFIIETRRALIFFDCIEQIKFASGFEKTSSMMKDLNDMCGRYTSNILISINPSLFEKQQLEYFERDLRKVESN